MQYSNVNVPIVMSFLILFCDHLAENSRNITNGSSLYPFAKKKKRFVFISRKEDYHRFLQIKNIFKVCEKNCS